MHDYRAQKAFSVIAEVPDSILDAGDDATTQWVTKHEHRNATHLEPESLASPDGGWIDVKCTLGIAAFIGANLVSAAKLLRIKKYIKALDEAAEAAELLLNCSTWDEKLASGGSKTGQQTMSAEYQT